MEEKEIKEEKIGKLKKYFICLKKGWLIVLIFVIIGLLTGFIIADKTFSKPYLEANYATLNFKYTKDIDFSYKDIISIDNINRCKNITKSLETGSKISTYQYVEIEDIKIEAHDSYFTIYANQDSFNVSKDYTYSDAAAKGFLKHLTLLPFITDKEIEEYNSSDIKGHSVFSNFDNEFYKSNSIDQDNHLLITYSNPNAISLNKEDRIKYYSIWVGSFILGTLILGLLFVYIYVDKLNLSIHKEYDNKEIYKTPFHESYFTDSIKYLKNMKSLVMIAIIMALVLICKFIPIPSGFGSLGIGFSYLFLSVGAMLFGPIPSLIIGALSDILGYFIHPDGIFFIGYTFQAMLACFTYALCFHKTYITFTRCLIARVIVNFICNVLIGSICWAFISHLDGAAFMTYMLTISLPKNIVYLLPQSLLLFFVLKAVSVPLFHMNLMDERISHNFSFF